MSVCDILFQNFDDLNGDFIIETLDYQSNNQLRSEYVNTIFTLYSKNQIWEGDVYIIGKFSDWQAKEEFRMSYDSKNQAYHADVLLKQGYYDYQYMIQYDDGTQDCRHYEGSHFGTINQYHALVYQRTFGKRYDQLIGVTTTISSF